MSKNNTNYQEKQQSENENLDQLYKEMEHDKEKMRKAVEKKIFDAAYGWGLWNIVIDETCNTFQDLLKEYREI